MQWSKRSSVARSCLYTPHQEKMWHYVLLLCFISQTRCDRDSPRIIVIGAGASGIAATSKLLQHHFKNVTILEAENRIGGRVHTTKFGGYWVDLGGQWVHGEKDNVAFELAWPLGLLERSVPQTERPMITYITNGTHIPDDISRSAMSKYSAIVDEDFKFNVTNWNDTLGEQLEKELTKSMGQIPQLDESTIKSFLKLFESFVNSLESTDSWHEVLAETEGYQACQGDQAINWKDRGYGTILDILMKKYPNPEEELPVLNNTILSTEVARIDYSPDKDEVAVITTNGNAYSADHVIVTTSLGVLKSQYETLFNPALPELKINAIKTLGFGSVAKIYLFFEEQWWPTDFSGFAFIWNDADRTLINNDPNRKWLLSLFALIPVESKPRLLCCWLSGQGAREMEKISEAVVLNQTLEYIRRALGKSYNIPEPKEMLRTLWHTNKHFRGTYSYRSAEAEKANISARHLEEPLMKNNKPTVLFGGEASNYWRHSTVHGAIEAGWREADRLIKLYSKNQ